MKKTPKNILTASALIAGRTGFSSSAQAQDINFDGSESTDFNTGGNWVGDTVPGGGNQAILGSTTLESATADFDTSTTTVNGIEAGDAQNNSFSNATTGVFNMNSGTLNMGYNHTGRFGGTGTFNITGGSIIQSTGFGGQWGTQGADSVGNLNMTDGILSLTGTHLFATDSGTSNVALSGGAWSTQGIAAGGNGGTANFTIVGDNATFTLGSNGFSSAGGTTNWTLDFGASGITKVDSSSTISFGGTDNLIIDLAGYTGGSEVTIFEAATSITGTFDDVSFINGDGLLTYNADSIVLSVTAVPEPSSYALIGGLLALGSVMVRRRS